MEIAFMVFGLGFFLFVVLMIERSEERSYQRRLNEAREFGYGGPDRHNIKTLKGK